MTQHWVPQHILWGFSSDDALICQYDKTGKIGPVKIGVKGACGRNDAFSEPVERLLSSIEGAANPAIDVFRRMEHPMRIDPVAKRIVSVYLNTFLWKRSPAIRDQQVYETNKADLLDGMRKRAKFYGSGLGDHLLKLSREAAADVNDLMAEHWKSNTFQRWLHYSMSWSVLSCAVPIVTVPDCGMFGLGSRGLLDPESEFYFPLSSTRLLVTSWHGASPDVIRFISASPAHMRRINKLGFGRARRFVYGQGYSQKVAEIVQRPSHHFQNLEALQAAGGLNPVVAKLDDLHSWYAKVGGDADHQYCIAPNAGYECRHNWRRPPYDIPVVSEMPEVRTPIRICIFCGGIERQYANGKVEFEDLELRRTTFEPPMKNWWQALSIESKGSRIEARKWEPTDAD